MASNLDLDKDNRINSRLLDNVDNKEQYVQITTMAFLLDNGDNHLPPVVSVQIMEVTEAFLLDNGVNHLLPPVVSIPMEAAVTEVFLLENEDNLLPLVVPVEEVPTEEDSMTMKTPLETSSHRTLET